MTWVPSWRHSEARCWTARDAANELDAVDPAGCLPWQPSRRTAPEGEDGLPERQAAVSIHLSSWPVLSSPRWLVWQGSTSWLICTSVGLRAGEGLAMAPGASSRSSGSWARGGQVEPCGAQKLRFTQRGSKSPEGTVTHEGTPHIEPGEPQPCTPPGTAKTHPVLAKDKVPAAKREKNPSKKRSIRDYSRFPGHLSPNPTAPSQTPHKTPPKVNHSSGKKFFSLTASFLGCCSTGWVCSPGAGECSTPSTNTPPLPKEALEAMWYKKQRRSILSLGLFGQ